MRRLPGRTRGPLSGCLSVDSGSGLGGAGPDSAGSGRIGADTRAVWAPLGARQGRHAPGHVGHSDGRRPRRRWGRLRRARGRATGGVAPYGFQFIDGRRAWHQGEQETRAAGLSWAKVADKLSGAGHRTRTGGQWTRQGAHQVH